MKDRKVIDFSVLPPECDVLCEWRSCLHKGENKGSFTVGRGYTSYYERPQYVCMTRLHHGCPDRDIPESTEMIASLKERREKLKMSRKVSFFINDLLIIIEKLVSCHKDYKERAACNEIQETQQRNRGRTMGRYVQRPCGSVLSGVSHIK